MTKNGITVSNVKFTVVSGDVDNSNYATNKVVNISSSDLAYTGNDNEVAAVVANELGHIISGHSSKGKVVSLLTAGSNTKHICEQFNSINFSSKLSNYKRRKRS